MTKMYVIYKLEKGGFGYKPAKINLPEGSRICLDKDIWKFAKVVKMVESTPESMKNAWNTAQVVSRVTPGSFIDTFIDHIEFFNY